MSYKYINSMVESEIKKGAEKAPKRPLGIINIFFGIKVERKKGKKRDMYCNQKALNSILTDKNSGYKVIYFREKLPFLNHLLLFNTLSFKSMRGRQEDDYLPEKNVTKIENMAKKVGTG